MQRKEWRRFILIVGGIVCAVILAGCTGGSQADGVVTEPEMMTSSIERIENPIVDDIDIVIAANGINAFAIELFQELRQNALQDNLVFSPFSAFVTLSMVYAGARGECATEMANGLRIELDDNRLHKALNSITQNLENQEHFHRDSSSDQACLSLVNDLWAQAGFDVLTEYLDLLAANYGTGVHTLDFRQRPEAARQTINEWISQQTDERVSNLLQRGSIGVDTLLIVTNALLFQGAWEAAFNEEATEDDLFTLLDETEIDVPMMSQESSLRSKRTDNAIVVELQYANSSLAMSIIVPNQGEFLAFTDAMTCDVFESLVAGLGASEIVLELPRFACETTHELQDPLHELGLSNVFTPGVADLSRIDGTRRLYLEQVVQSALIEVDEKGTEAAAATATVLVDYIGAHESFMSGIISVDRPFIFAVRDVRTGIILFLGQVTNPLNR